MRYRLSASKVLLALLGLLPLAVIASLAVGPVSNGLADLLRVLPAVLNREVPSDSSLVRLYIIVSDIRLPRTLMAMLVGAGLAVSGAAMQGLFRNALADPSIIGVTSGASLGASVAVVLGASLGFEIPTAFTSWGLAAVLSPVLSTMVVGAFVGGLLAVWLVYRLATGPYGTSVTTMLLAGIAVTALAAAANSALVYYADNEMLRRISLWNMGGLDAADNGRVVLAALIIVPSIVMIL